MNDSNIGLRKYKEDFEIAPSLIPGSAIVLKSKIETKLIVPFFDVRRVTAVFNFIGGSPVWVCNGGIASQPTQNSWVITNSQPNPTQRDVESEDVLSFYNGASEDVICCVYFYAYQYGL